MPRGYPAWASWWSTPIRHSRARNGFPPAHARLGLHHLWQVRSASPARPDPSTWSLEKVPGGPRGINHWLVNGKNIRMNGNSFSGRDAATGWSFTIAAMTATRAHAPAPVELVELNGKPTAGILKDTVIVPAFGRATVDLVADQPGLTLFHCHIQHHMDFGFKALFRYA